MVAAIVKLAAHIVVPLGGGIVGSLTSNKAVRHWYPRLMKPKWTPPSWLFGPVWSCLYIGMGTASFLIARRGVTFSQGPLKLYGAQLALNFAWTPLFFGARRIRAALVDIIALDAALLATTVAFFKQSAVAGSLLVPYLAWTSFATALNARIALDNPPSPSTDSQSREK